MVSNIIGYRNSSLLLLEFILKCPIKRLLWFLNRMFVNTVITLSCSETDSFPASSSTKLSLLAYGKDDVGSRLFEEIERLDSKFVLLTLCHAPLTPPYYFMFVGVHDDAFGQVFVKHKKHLRNCLQERYHDTCLNAIYCCSNASEQQHFHVLKHYLLLLAHIPQDTIDRLSFIFQSNSSH